jgi:hypothetical protein
MNSQELLRYFQRFARDVLCPAECTYCDGTHVVWNGWATRTASLLRDGVVAYVIGIPIRRARCRACGRSWRVRPPGLMPQRHYQLCVVADGVGRLLADAAETIASIAERSTCSRWTVSRWLAWLGRVATSADLTARLVEVSDAPLLVDLPTVARPTLRSVASIVAGLEALGTALRFEPPGLRAVLEGVIADRYRHTTYRRPPIPEFAQFSFGGRFGMLGG